MGTYISFWYQRLARESSRPGPLFGQYVKKKNSSQNLEQNLLNPAVIDYSLSLGVQPVVTLCMQFSTAMGLNILNVGSSALGCAASNLRVLWRVDFP